jgi:hypothetical protein
MFLKSLGFLLVLSLAACKTAEAEDPHSLLGEDAEYNGVDGTTGARGTKESRSPGKPESESGPLATQAQCQAAARRIEELALDLAIKDEQDPAARTELQNKKQAELNSAAFKSRVTQAAKDCIGRDTTSREATCIAKAQNELDVDRCSSR